MSVASLNETRAMTRVIETSLDKIMPGIKEQAFDFNPTMSFFCGRLATDLFGAGPMSGRGKQTITGGDSIRINLNLGKNTSTKSLNGSYDTVDTTPNDTIRHARASWKEYTSTITVPRFEVLANASPEAVASLLETEAKNAVCSLAEFVGGHIFNNAGVGTRVTSLQTLVNANNSVQGIDGGTYSRWNSRGVSTRGTAPGSISFASGSFANQGIQDMRLSWLGCEEGTRMPNVGVTTHTIFSYYEGSLQPQERFTDSRVADGGFQQLKFKAAPIFADPLCNSGELYWLNFDSIKFVVMSGGDFNRMEFVRDTESMVEVSVVYLVCQLITENRFAGVNKLTGITA